MNPELSNSKASTAPLSRRHFLKRTAVSAALVNSVALGSLLSSHAIAAEPSDDLALEADGELAVDPSLRVEEHLADAAASITLDPMESRRLHLVNAHTWDDLDVVYYTHGIYIDENIERLNHLMRDRRANQTTAMDPALYDQLLSVQRVLGTDKPVHILSGYRTPETNAKLRRRSPGVAKYSYHMAGQAADIYIPGIAVQDLQQAALSLQAGGVGVYSKSNFVHIDTGPVRRWGS